MRKVLLAPLLACLFPVLATLSISPVLGSATLLTASGSYTVVAVNWTHTWTVDGWFIGTGTHTLNWTGTLTGTAVYDHFIMISPTGEVFVTLRGTFNSCTVDGKTGTMCMSIVGKGSVVTGELQFRWVISNGTGGLANIHGLGTGSGILGANGTYSGHIYFGPP